MRRAAAALVVVVLAACVPAETLPATCQDPAVSFTSTLSDKGLDPATFDVCRGQQVTISFSIERDGILHLHGYDDELGAREVRAGMPTQFVFDAVRSGQFPIALHTLSAQTEELTVGTLVVHEP